MQCNLKQTVGAFDNQQLLPGFLDLRGGDLHTQEELLSLQRLKESVVTPALSQRPVITLASFLPVCHSPCRLARWSRLRLAMSSYVIADEPAKL